MGRWPGPGGATMCQGATLGFWSSSIGNWLIMALRRSGMGQSDMFFGYEAAANPSPRRCRCRCSVDRLAGIAAANPVEKHGDSGFCPCRSSPCRRRPRRRRGHYSHSSIATIRPIARTNPITRARIIRTPRTSPTRRISPRVRDRPPRRRRRPSHRVRRRRPPRTATTGITTSGHTTMRTRSRPPRPARARVHRRRPQRRAPSPRLTPILRLTTTVSRRASA